MSESEQPPKNVRLVAAPEVLQVQCVAPSDKKSPARRIFSYLLLVLFLTSIVANVYMGLLLKAQLTSSFSASVLSDGSEDEIVAVYNIEGTIGAATSAKFDRFYRFLKDTPEIKAVVLRVNSPGGTISDSDRIYLKIVDIKEKLKRTVVVSQGSVAASGGYYISVPAERIFAERSTITGSIGVIAMYPAFRGLADKLGVEIITIRSRQGTRWKARPEGVDVPDARVMEEVQAMMDDFHTQFADVVKLHRKDIKETSTKVEITTAAGKKETIEEINPFNGTIYRGPEAVDIKLVDEIGLLDDATDYAAKAAGLENPRVVRYYTAPTLMQALGMPFAEVVQSAKALENITSPRILMLWKLD